MDETIKTNTREHISVSHHALLSWRSVLAGLLVAFLTYIVLMSLGAGIGANNLVGVINNADKEAGNGLAVGAGIWVLISAFISRGVGSYFAARLSHFVTARVGWAQGIVIAALFFGALIMETTTTIGAIGGGIGSLAGAIGNKTGDLLKNPEVQSTVERGLGGLNLRNDPDIVAQGVAVRLMRGDEESARNYFAYQANMTRPEADARFEQLKNDFNAKAKDAGVAAAKGVSAAGWGLFITLVLGTFFAGLGGSLGSRANLRKPLTDEDYAGQTALDPRTV